MLNKERLNFIVEDINIYFEKLRKIAPTKENLNNDEKFLSTSMASFQILNRMIDLADEIVKIEKIGYPLQIKDLFTFLEEKNIIDKKLERKLKDLVISRNKFSHRYGNINKEEILLILKELDSVKDFIKVILAHLNKK
mgnify:FL=1